MEMIWIPGHADIEYNEVADKLAKVGSMSERDLVREEVSDSVTGKWIRDQIFLKWKNMWIRSEGGDWTKDLIGGEVGNKIVFPKSRCIGMSYVRALVNNAAVKDNLFRMGFSEGRICECNQGRETVDHVLMECQLEAEARLKLKENICKMWMESKCSGNLQFNLQLMLFPFGNTNLNSNLASQILFKTYSFLKDLLRRM